MNQKIFTANYKNQLCRWVAKKNLKGCRALLPYFLKCGHGFEGNGPGDVN